MCVQMKDLLAYLTSLLAPQEHEMILPLGENSRRRISPDIMRLGFGFLNKFCTNLVLRGLFKSTLKELNLVLSTVPCHKF